MPLLLDAAYTLFHPAEPVGEVYARHLRQASGLLVEPARMQSTFAEVFPSASPPDYARHPSGHEAEHDWWRDLVARVLSSLGGQARTFASGDPHAFDSFFNSLFEHYASPEAWSLYPETVPFLEAALPIGPLAVVSNFDDRLHGILAGHGINSSFQTILTSADARARKPSPGIFNLALERLACAPGDAIHCGDSHHADYEGARAAGLRAFHLQRPQHSLFDFLSFCKG